ncbi:MAG: NAD(P)-dependent oxidoreductase, partial [Gammaproteobacteria bacterium]|nr:NAD(P)-dependent oxidoreductase [Gammaproteobacteria bacterium]
LTGACPLIITCVSRDADVRDVIEQIAMAATPETLVVDTSTVADSTARQAAAMLAECGAGFLDAPVTGGVEGARKGSLSMMVGGPPELLERARPALAAVAARIVHMGPTGAGQATKAVNQIICAGINQAVSEGFAFGRGLGLDLDKVLEVIAGGAAGNWFMDHRGPTMIRGTFAPGFKLNLHHKDLSICRAMGQDHDDMPPLPIVEMTMEHYDRLMRAGYGDEDISALFRLRSGSLDDGAGT